MELSWAMKFRIAAVAALGVVFIGILGWRWVEPTVTTGSVNSGGSVVLVALALLAGFVGYFVAWPYGRQMGILAAPFGLAVWAVRSGSMSSLLQDYPTAAQRQELIASLKWEPMIWLVIVAAGFVGPILCHRILPTKKTGEKKTASKIRLDNILSMAGGLGGSILIAQFCIKMFAQDVALPDKGLGIVVAQPNIGQIVFAVFISFGIAAFVVKKFLNVGYFWPIISTFFVTLIFLSLYAKNAGYIAGNWPAAFFSNSVVSILPVEMVAFGTLGAVAGYWMAIRYDYWRKHEM